MPQETKPCNGCAWQKSPYLFLPTFLHPKTIKMFNTLILPYWDLFDTSDFTQISNPIHTAGTQLAADQIQLSDGFTSMSNLKQFAGSASRFQWRLQLGTFHESSHVSCIQWILNVKLRDSVQHIFTSKKGDKQQYVFHFQCFKRNSNAEKHRQMHKHMQCTCSSHCCEKWGTFQHLPRFRTDSDGTQISLSSNKAKMIARTPLIQDHPLRPLTSSGCNHMGENWTFKINKKGGKHVFGLWKSKWKDANDLKRKKWHLYQPGKRPRCWFALKTNADARMPKGRLSNCCPNQWTSMTITGFTACICWDPQVFKPIFSKLMLVGDVDGSCGS